MRFKKTRRGMGWLFNNFKKRLLKFGQKRYLCK